MKRALNQRIYPQSLPHSNLRIERKSLRLNFFKEIIRGLTPSNLRFRGPENKEGQIQINFLIS